MIAIHPSALCFVFWFVIVFFVTFLNQKKNNRRDDEFLCLTAVSIPKAPQECWYGLNKISTCVCFSWIIHLDGPNTGKVYIG